MFTYSDCFPAIYMSDNLLKNFCDQQDCFITFNTCIVLYFTVNVNSLNTLMNKYLVYLDFPAVPEELIESVDSIIKKPPKSASNVSPSYHSFQTRNVSDELAAWIKENIHPDSHAQYQIVRAGIPIHKDRGRNVAFNYLLQAGGNSVTTSMHDEDKNLICQECIPLKQWHRLRTDVFHGINGLTTDRVALSVDINGYVWNDSL